MLKGNVQITETENVIMLYIAVLITRIGYGLLIITFPAYIHYASGKVVGTSLALYPIFEAISATFIGSYSDRKGRKNVFLIGLLSSGIFMSLISITTNIYIISFMHALMGISASAVTVSTLTMLTDLTVIENRGTGMGAFDFFNIIGYALGILLSSWLISIFYHKLHYVFLVAGTLFFATTMLSLFLKEPHHKFSEHFHANPFTALDKNAKSMLPLWFAVTFLLGIVFFSPKALATFGIRPSETGILLFIGAIMLGIGSVFFGMLSDRIGREKTILIGTIGIIGVLGSLIYLIEKQKRISENLLINIIEIIRRDISFAIIAGISIFMMTAIVPSILAYTGDKAHIDRRGSAMGLYSTMLSIGVASGNLIAGFAFDLGGPSAIFRIAMIIFVIMSLLTVALKYLASSS
ncbi:MAG: MFS transporter [Thermoprotei archaeon]